MLFAASAQAQDTYPSRPIRLLVPFPAGGAADTIGRTIGAQLTIQMKQPVVTDNRPGAAGRIATGMLARAEPDGYTLLVGTPGAITVSPSLYTDLPYSVERDIAPITRVGEVINVLVIHASTGVKTTKELVEWTRSKGSSVRYGSSGIGQTDHLAGELFQRLAGLRMTHVPYKGGGPALIDLLAGEIHVMFPTSVVALPHVNAGKLRALAVTTAERQSMLPDLPTVSDTIPGFEVRNWDGIFAPAKTPTRIADRLFSEINKALENAELRKVQQGAGIVPIGSPSRSEFIQFVRADTAKWARVIKEAGIKPE
jgi:tripartite-type tricarboxylate transporter receptor subunit TctC